MFVPPPFTCWLYFLMDQLEELTIHRFWLLWHFFFFCYPLATRNFLLWQSKICQFYPWIIFFFKFSICSITHSGFWSIRNWRHIAFMLLVLMLSQCCLVTLNYKHNSKLLFLDHYGFCVEYLWNIQCTAYALLLFLNARMP